MIDLFVKMHKLKMHLRSNKGMCLSKMHKLKELKEMYKSFKKTHKLY